MKLEIKNILSKIASHDGNLLTICLLQFSVVRVPFGSESKNWQSKNLLATQAIAAHIRVKILTPFI